jgi:hypothetical protein
MRYASYISDWQTAFTKNNVGDKQKLVSCCKGRVVASRPCFCMENGMLLNSMSIAKQNDLLWFDGICHRRH